MTEPLLHIDDLTVSFPAPGNKRLLAAHGVNLAIYPGQTLAVVGESGSGKSVSALSILQLIPTPPGRYDCGSIHFRGRDLLTLNDRQMRQVRGDQIAMIFQEPMTSLNPVYTIGSQIVEAVRLHQHVTPDGALAVAEKALRDVGIADPASRLREYPHQLSGGMRQRVMIAMALACEPQLLLADEPTTALDVTIQAQILELLRVIQHDRNMAVMLITHDLGVVAENADVVAVMFAGRVLEVAGVETLFDRPLHPYTRGLLTSMPILGSNTHRLPTVMDGATPPEDFPTGYRIEPHHPSPDQTGAAPYGGAHAKLHEVEPQHWVLCEAPAPGSDATTATKPHLNYRRGVGIST